MKNSIYGRWFLRFWVSLENRKAGAVEWFSSHAKLLSQLLRQYREFPVDFVGSNWAKDGDIPIAICFGFNPWKRQIVSSYLSEYRTAFAVGFAGFPRVFSAFIRRIPDGVGVVYVFWGAKRSRQFELYCKVFRKRPQVIRVEDGFLRSMGSGLLHTRPASLCVDDRSIYFNAHEKSRLETILSEHDFQSSPGLIERARRCIALMGEARLTKYYSIQPYDNRTKASPSDRYAILVLGQVEDDASVVHGQAKIRRNNDLVLRAREEFPNADIYYRPHPDYWNNTRNSRTSSKKLDGICTIVSPDISLYDMFEVVDHVFTITSLAALEALFFGLKVTCFGAPFYSGWGLTDDRSPSSRRARKLTKEELFAAAYLIYPRYIHPQSDEVTTFEDVAGYFICESLKYENIFEPSAAWRLFDKSLPFADILPKPFSVLAYLKSTGDFAAADQAKLMEIAQADFRLADYPLVSHFMARTSNYDALVAYSNHAIEYLESNREVITRNSTLAESFFYALSLSLLNSNGRVIRTLPDLSDEIVRLPNKDQNFPNLLKNYTRCLSANLQYADIEKLVTASKAHAEAFDRDLMSSHRSIEDHVREALAFGLSTKNHRDMCQVLRQKPTRSERDFARRHQLIFSAASSYLQGIEVEFDKPVDAFINRLLYWVLLEDNAAAGRAWADLCAAYGGEDEEKRVITALLPRRSNLLSVAEYFVRNDLPEVARQIIARLGLEGAEETRLLELQMARKAADLGAFHRLYERRKASSPKSDRELTVYARLLRELGMFERSRLINQDLFVSAKTLARRSSIREEIRKIEFLQQTSRILNSVPQPGLPKGVVFLASQTCFNTLAMMTPALVELKKLGYAVVDLCSGMSEHQFVGIDFIDDFYGAIPIDLAAEQMVNEWKIDWPNKVVRSNGINFYQGFYEGLSVYCRRYHVDINSPLIKEKFFSYLKRADLCLALCSKVFREVVGRGVPVSFVSGNSHIVPFSVFRDFARAKNHPLLGFVNCNVAYESYFSNLGSKFANTMCVTDMTLHPNIRAPFMARPDQFERWYEENRDNPDYIEKAKALINVNRVGSTSNDKERELLDFIVEQKRKGRKIVCAFGKVPVDLNVPYDGGPAHDDMADWINNTVEVCGRSADIILLVKPHPHELRPEIALDLVEGFHDLITVPVNENVILLGHKDINGHALAPHLDLALLYNGSSGLELTAQGIPVVMTSYFGRHDYPVDLNYPESRQQYEEFLLSGNYPAPSVEVRKRAAFLMSYLGTDEISILNRYSKRQLTNDKIGVPTWRADLVEKFLRDGDPKMTLIANRIVEKFSVTH